MEKMNRSVKIAAAVVLGLVILGAGLQATLPDLERSTVRSVPAVTRSGGVESGGVESGGAANPAANSGDWAQPDASSSGQVNTDGAAAGFAAPANGAFGAAGDASGAAPQTGLTGDDMGDSSVTGGYWDRQGTQDRTVRDMDNQILDQQTMRDPATGETFQVDSGNDEYYRSPSADAAVGDNGIVGVNDGETAPSDGTLLVPDTGGSVGDSSSSYSSPSADTSSGGEGQ